MLDIFNPGDRKTHIFKVLISDIAKFEQGVVHQVCSTLALAREMEWSSRLFVLEMKEAHEEGIGTMLQINHLGPAFPGEDLHITAEFRELKGNSLTCAITVKTGERLVATGLTGQKIVNKQKLADLFNSLQGTEPK